MPSQETFASAKTGNHFLQVIKTYDRTFAREAFEQMNEEAYRFLGKSLGPDAISASGNPLTVVDTDILWEEIEDGAREDWNSFSYFVVTRAADNGSAAPIFVSADWPTAERFMEYEIATTTR